MMDWQSSSESETVSPEFEFPMSELPVQEARDPNIGISSDAPQEAVAIMVHGTYSAASEDAGHRWWQSGSPVALRLESLFPSCITGAGKGEVFHWSGENSERARSKAAAKLLRHLHSLEEQGRDYHLVGHSHGGSVIWNALQLSVRVKRPLRCLVSWTTVGTPFMQHQSRGALNVMNLLGLIIGLCLLLPALEAPKRLLMTMYNVAVDNRAAVVLEPDHVVGYSSLLRRPVLAVIERFGITVERKLDGIHVGNFDPAGSQSLAEYFFATPEGLFLMVVMIAMSYIIIHFMVLCISPAIESYRIRFEQRLHRRAFEAYSSRWLGIWSPDDEAINGLRATLNMSVSFVGKMLPREVVYLSDILALLSRPYYWLLSPAYNRFVHPALDGKVRSVVIRAAQGNDRPTATLIDVTPYPVAVDAFTPPPLPALLNVKLLALANRNAHDLVPKLRNLIALTSFTSGLESFSAKLSGKELVHTAYFEMEEVLKLIAANMSWQTANGDPSAALPSMPPWLRKWFVTYKEGVSQNQVGLDQTQTSSLGEASSLKQRESLARKAG